MDIFAGSGGVLAAFGARERVGSGNICDSVLRHFIRCRASEGARVLRRVTACRRAAGSVGATKSFMLMSVNPDVMIELHLNPDPNRSLC